MPFSELPDSFPKNSRKKAQKTQKRIKFYFAFFAPFCGYVLI